MDSKFIMVIAAFPQAAAKIVLVKEGVDPTNAPSWTCWATELVENICNIAELYKDEIERIQILSVDSFIQPIIGELKQKINLPIEMME